MEMLEDWGTMGRLCFFGMLMICAEWWVYEVAVILSGLLGTRALVAQTIAFTVDTLLFGVRLHGRVLNNV